MLAVKFLPFSTIICVKIATKLFTEVLCQPLDEGGAMVLTAENIDVQALIRNWFDK